MHKILTLILITAMLGGCISRLLQQPITLTNDNYKALCSPLIVQPQQEFVVSLPSSKITGYKWQLEKNGAPILVLQKNNTQKDDTPESRLHREETLWTFKAAQVGQTTLSFIYQLDWDTDVADAQRVQCNVQVKSQ